MRWRHHHGHHHGMDGLLLILSALLLSRALNQIKGGALGIVVSAYLALMFCYGAANIANRPATPPCAMSGSGRA